MLTLALVGVLELVLRFTAGMLFLVLGAFPGLFIPYAAIADNPEQIKVFTHSSCFELISKIVVADVVSRKEYDRLAAKHAELQGLLLKGD